MHLKNSRGMVYRGLQSGLCLRLLGAVACCTASSASAGLDETAGQNQARYGAPLQQGADPFWSQPVSVGAVTRTYRQHQHPT